MEVRVTFDDLKEAAKKERYLLENDLNLIITSANGQHWIVEKEVFFETLKKLVNMDVNGDIFKFYDDTYYEVKWVDEAKMFKFVPIDILKKTKEEN